MDISIETAGKRSLRLEQAGQVIEASRASLEYTASQVRAYLRLNLLSLCLAEQRLQLLSTSVLHQKKAAEMQMRRVEGGKSSRSDS